MLDNYTDIELIEKIKSDGISSEEAFKEIFRRYSKRIYFFCRKFLGNSTLAEDATQDTFLNFLQYLKDDKDIDNVKSFLFRVAKNICINSKNIEKRYDIFIENTNLQYSENLHDSKELAKLIESALELLPEDHKEAFCLQMYSGLTYKEIAEINNVKITTVRNWVVRAKMKLRKILSPYLEEMS